MGKHPAVQFKYLWSCRNKRYFKFQQGKYKDLPVIAFTANAVSGAKKMFTQEGFNDYIAKPIDMDKLSLIFLENIPDDKIEYIL